jgi:transcriptional regulator with XRE-family HTH domain
MTPEAVKEAISNNYMTKQSGEMERAVCPMASRPMASGISNCLTEWRYNEHLTQKEAGELLGVSQTTYGWIERGMTKPEGKLLNDIVELTGLSMHQIASIFTGSSAKYKVSPSSISGKTRERKEPLTSGYNREVILEVKTDADGCPYTDDSVLNKKPAEPKPTYSYGKKIVEIEDPYGNVHKDILEPDPDEPEVIASPITPEEFAALNNKEVHEKMDEVITERDENGKPVAGRYPWQMTEEEAEALNEPHDFRDEVIDEVLEKMYGQMDYKKYVYLIGLLGR